MTTAAHNTALGLGALSGSTTIAAPRVTSYCVGGHNNIAIGVYALQRLTTGCDNIAVGYRAGWRLTTQCQMVRLGPWGIIRFRHRGGPVARWLRSWALRRAESLLRR